MIYYFTGTGNSEFVARRIAAKTGLDCVAVYEAIRDGVPFAPRNNETLVFAAPTHCWRLPRIVESWIRNGKKAENVKAYFVLTCGSDVGNAGKHAKKLCGELGFEYMGLGEVVMPENYVAMFAVPGEDEAKAIVKKAIPVIDGYAGEIMRGEVFAPNRKKPFSALKSGIVNDGFYAFAVKDKSFTVSDACVSCGKCASTCVTHNITLKDGKPQWGGSCIHCMRCICDCPKAAIEYGKESVGKPRYHCPEA